MKRHILRVALSLAIVMAAGGEGVAARVRLPRLVGDGMVLQRDTPLTVWGRADAGERVSVTFQGKSYATRADRRGDWSIGLGKFSAGGPYTMRVGEVELRDVMVGEVWLCSGQSNMELPLSRVTDMFADEIAGMNYPNIRHFRVPITYRFDGPADDLAGGEWLAATPDNLPDFSAVAFFFGKELHELYGVPVGLIDTGVGGSPVEAWVSPRSIAKYPDHLAAARECARPGFVDSVRRADAARGAEWYRSLDEADTGVARRHRLDIDMTDWSPISLPGYTADKGFDTGPGTVWFRKELELPDGVSEREAVLRLGVVVDADSTWVNGTFVGNVTYQYPPRVYRVPAGVLRSGRNVVAVRVTSNSGRGGFVEEKPYKLIVGGEEFDLTGEWLCRVGARVAPAPSYTTFQYKPTGLYNGMIAPLGRFAVKGVLWYQGESNTGRAGEYLPLMTDMINDWRALRGEGDMPFIQAQLPEFLKERKGPPAESGWAALRDAQRRVLEIPATGMATTLGLGEWNDIHPLDKKSVAHRLALEARRVAYGEGEASGAGPIFESVDVEGSAAVVTFRCIGSELYTNLAPAGFAIAGADGRWVWAEAAFLSGGRVRVWNDGVKEPAAVRYAWADNPAGANIRDKRGVAASTFEARIEQ